MLGHRGYYRDGWEIVTLHQGIDRVRRPRVGAVRPAQRPHRVHRPGGRPSREGGRAGRGVGAGGVGQPGLPARRGHHPQAHLPARWVEQYERARSRSCRARRHSSGGAASGCCGHAVVHRAPSTRLRRRRRRDPGGPRRPGRRLRRCRSRTIGCLRPQRRPRHGPPPRRRHRWRPARRRITSTATAPGGNSWDVAVAVDGTETAGEGGFDHPVPHGTVRGHRRGHRPPITGVVGDLRGPRTVPVHRHRSSRSPTSREIPPLTHPDSCSTCCGTSAFSTSSARGSGDGARSSQVGDLFRREPGLRQHLVGVRPHTAR